MRGTWRTIGGLAALIGGAAWTIKAGTILLVGIQPPLSFELGPPLFLLATWTLLLLVWTRSTLMVYAAIILSLVTFGFPTALALHLFADGPHPLHSLGISLGLLLALVFVGLRVRRVRSLSPPWHLLPFWMGLLLVPLLAVFGGAGALLGPAFEERLIEVPLLLFGIGWVLVGIQMLRRVGTDRTEDDASASPRDDTII